jgi:dihydropteroate synthase
MNRGTLEWKCGERVLKLADQPLIMGILNATPDSFSDGGRHFGDEAAATHGRRLLEEGADIVDVGGESTRPGAAEVTEEEELRRVMPVVRALAREGALVSIDTRRAAVARCAVEAGARIVNDVTALTGDARMPALARETGVGVVLMHMRGTPRTMQTDPRYGNVAAEVSEYLAERIRALEAAGLDRRQMAVDPGIGFGKTVEHNLALLRELPRLQALSVPVVVGLSRKSFVGQLTGRPVDERLAGSLAAMVFCILKGAQVMRVHDVKESRDAMRVILALRRDGGD